MPHADAFEHGAWQVLPQVLRMFRAHRVQFTHREVGVDGVDAVETPRRLDLNANRLSTASVQQAAPQRVGDANLPRGDEARDLADFDQRWAGERKLPSVEHAADVDHGHGAAGECDAQRQRHAVDAERVAMTLDVQCALRGTPAALIETGVFVCAPQRDQCITCKLGDIAAMSMHQLDELLEILVHDCRQALCAHRPEPGESFGETGEAGDVCIQHDRREIAAEGGGFLIAKRHHLLDDDLGQVRQILAQLFREGDRHRLPESSTNGGFWHRSRCGNTVSSMPGER